MTVYKNPGSLDYSGAVLSNIGTMAEALATISANASAFVAPSGLTPGVAVSALPSVVGPLSLAIAGTQVAPVASTLDGIDTMLFNDNFAGLTAAMGFAQTQFTFGLRFALLDASTATTAYIGGTSDRDVYLAKRYRAEGHVIEPATGERGVLSAPIIGWHTVIHTRDGVTRYLKTDVDLKTSTAGAISYNGICIGRTDTLVAQVMHVRSAVVAGGYCIPGSRGWNAMEAFLNA